MSIQRGPRMPAKSQLSWRIARLRLDGSGRCWIATGYKGSRAAVIVLPDRTDSDSDESWLATIEAAFEENACDPTVDSEAPDPAALCSTNERVS